MYELILRAAVRALERRKLPGGLGMNRLCCGLMAGSILVANPAFAGQPALVDGKGHAVV
jgi:hypothetical protein